MHDCPDCGQACYCGGDCEDHDTGDEYVDDCVCCLFREDEPDYFADCGDQFSETQPVGKSAEPK